MAKILCKRGTRAQLDSAAAESGLQAGEPYYIADEQRMAIGTAADSYRGLLREGEPTIAQPEANLGNLGAAATLDAAAGNKQRATLNANCTITLATPAAAVHIRLRLVNSGVGYAVTWPATLRWIGGVAPEFDDADGAENVVVLDYGASGWIADGGAL
jgi:hypothetical protein